MLVRKQAGEKERDKKEKRRGKKRRGKREFLGPSGDIQNHAGRTTRSLFSATVSTDDSRSPFFLSTVSSSASLSRELVQNKKDKKKKRKKKKKKNLAATSLAKFKLFLGGGRPEKGTRVENPTTAPTKEGARDKKKNQGDDNYFLPQSSLVGEPVIASSTGYGDEDADKRKSRRRSSTSKMSSIITFLGVDERRRSHLHGRNTSTTKGGSSSQAAPCGQNKSSAASRYKNSCSSDRSTSSFSSDNSSEDEEDAYEDHFADHYPIVIWSYLALQVFWAWHYGFYVPTEGQVWTGVFGIHCSGGCYKILLDNRYSLFRYYEYALNHGYMQHLLSNLAMEFFLATPLELVHGHSIMLCLILFGISGGMLAFSCMQPSEGISGSSGFGYSLFGVWFADTFINWTELSEGDNMCMFLPFACPVCPCLGRTTSNDDLGTVRWLRIPFSWMRICVLTLMVIFEIRTASLSMDGTTVAHSCHWGGFVVAFLFSPIFLRNISSSRAERMATVVLFCLGVLLMFFMTHWVVTNDIPHPLLTEFGESLATNPMCNYDTMREKLNFQDGFWTPESECPDPRQFLQQVSGAFDRPKNQKDFNAR